MKLFFLLTLVFVPVIPASPVRFSNDSSTQDGLQSISEAVEPIFEEVEFGGEDTLCDDCELDYDDPENAQFTRDMETTAEEKSRAAQTKFQSIIITWVLGAIFAIILICMIIIITIIGVRAVMVRDHKHKQETKEIDN